MYFIDELRNRKGDAFAVKCNSLEENQFVFKFLISNNILGNFSESSKKEVISHFENEQLLFVIMEGMCNCIKKFRETDKTWYDVFDFSDFNWIGSCTKMIEVEGYKAFHGTMRITPKSTDHQPIDITGDWLYKPEWNCWYTDGESFDAEICEVVEDKGDLKNE